MVLHQYHPLGFEGWRCYSIGDDMSRSPLVGQELEMRKREEGEEEKEGEKGVKVRG